MKTQIELKRKPIKPIFPHACTCGKILKKDNAQFIGETTDEGIHEWFNCRFCGSTFVKEVKGNKK